TVRNEEMEGIDRSHSRGIGVRVLVDGYWGFAATARSEPAEVERTAGLAVDIARAAARLPMEPIRLAEVEPVKGTWATPLQEDPFEVPLDQKVSLLMEASARLRQVPGLSFGESSLDFYRRHTTFVSSDGSELDQTIVHSGGGLEATAIADAEMQKRACPNSVRCHLRAAGLKHIRRLPLM